MRRTMIILAVILIGFAAGVVFLSMRKKDTGNTDRTSQQASTGNSPSLIDATTLSSLAQKSPSTIDMTHLASDVTPPTNKWFSSFALQAESEPGFAFPNSYRPTNNGIEINLPHVTASAKAIMGPHAASMVLTIDGATRYAVSRYDELTVDITYYAKDKKLATITLGSGLPYAYIAADQPIVMHSNLSNATKTNSGSEQQLADGVYGLASNDAKASGSTINLSKGTHVTAYTAPSKDAASIVRNTAMNRANSGTVSYKKLGNAFETTLHYNTDANKPTLVALMPHQQQSQAITSAVYRSIYGNMTTAATTEVRYTSKQVDLKQSLDVSKLAQADKTAVLNQLKVDAKNTHFTKNDTYFSGKEMYRAAQLLDIAEQLGAKEETKTLHDGLKSSLKEWFAKQKSEPKSFYYDKSMKGIVGNVASFGSDTEFNDHHFHYGYFIYAASILASYDASFKKEYTSTVNLLVADIANYKTGEALPLRRNYDAYAGHSWASGTAKYGDGNNQESSSEAISAWTAVGLWAQQSANPTLGLEAQWMLANEATTAKTYWLESNSQNAEYLRAYSAPVVSVNWGGKREYSTFFSDEANAKLAIQLLPMNPTMKFIKTTPTMRKDTQPAAPFGDYILMAQPDASIADAQKLPDTSIDDGSSRTYLYAWITTR